MMIVPILEYTSLTESRKNLRGIEKSAVEIATWESKNRSWIGAVAGLLIAFSIRVYGFSYFLPCNFASNLRESRESKQFIERLCGLCFQWKVPFFLMLIVNKHYNKLTNDETQSSPFFTKLSSVCLVRWKSSAFHHKRVILRITTTIILNVKSFLDWSHCQSINSQSLTQIMYTEKKKFKRRLWLMTYIFPVTASWKVFVHHATIIILAEKCAKIMEVSTSTHTKNDINAKCFHYKYKKWDPIIFVAQKYIFTIGKIHKRWTKREKNVTRGKAKQKELSQLLRYLSLFFLHKYINELHFAFRFKAEFFLFCTEYPII